MTTAVLLSEAFSQYNLEIPSDVCTIVDSYLKGEPHLCCECCNIDLLNLVITKPFVKHIPTYYSLYYGNVFTSDGMLTRTKEKHADIHLSSEGMLKSETTPDIIDVCGIHVKNEI